MLRSTTLAALLSLLLTLPASGMKAPIYQLPCDTLVTASALLRSGEYTGAVRLAKGAPDSGARDFIAGIAAFKAQEWETAAQHLAAAGKTYQLLADYALLFQAQSLQNLKKQSEIPSVVQTLLKNHPDTPLKRQALLLSADALFEQNSHKSALAAYQKFIESYPSGSDSLTAQYRIALCREALGEAPAAVKVLRNLWLANPASPVAAQADTVLKRLVAAGTPAPPFTADELLRRGTTLLDSKKYAQAVTALKSVPRDGQNRDFIERLDLKTGQALYRNRAYREAEPVFARLSASTVDQSHAAEATYWLARCLDRSGKTDDAVKTFLKVADSWPKAGEADNALFEAALAKKSELRWSETSELLKRLFENYPNSGLMNQVLWEGGWSCYKSGDLKQAADYFSRLSRSDGSRDRALYWLSRSLAAAGDASGAASAYATLLRDFPMSYYTLAQPQLGGIAGGSPELVPTLRLAPDALDALPLPGGHERVKALITFGLTVEAKKELSLAKSKSADTARILGIARLYLEMDDYNGAYNLAGRDKARLTENDPALTLAMLYPLPYRPLAAGSASCNKLPLALVYAIIRSESSFSPTAISPAGAVGLMQLMPSTAALTEGAGRKTVPVDQLKDPELNIGFGTRHMKDLLKEYDNNLIAVIASYNAGGTAVNRWIKNFGKLPQDEFIEQIPYGETRDYVKKVLAATAMYARLYGLGLDGRSLPLPAKPLQLN